MKRGARVLGMVGLALVTWASVAAGEEPKPKVKRMYDGRARETGAIAVLRVHDDVELAVGRPDKPPILVETKGKPFLLEFLPGTHKMLVQAFVAGGREAMKMTAELSLQAGHRYHLALAAWTGVPLVIDEADGARVFPPLEGKHDNGRDWPPGNWAWLFSCTDDFAVMTFKKAAHARKGLMALPPGPNELVLAPRAEQRLMGRLLVSSMTQLSVPFRASAGHVYLLAFGAGARMPVIVDATQGNQTAYSFLAIGDPKEIFGQCRLSLEARLQESVAGELPSALRELVPLDPGATLELSQSRCAEGSARSCYEAAVMHVSGVGTKPSLLTAFDFYRKACDQGEALACARLRSLEP